MQKSRGRLTPIVLSSLVAALAVACSPGLSPAEDAGPDGPDPVDPVDPAVLGTLTLNEGYSLVGSASLPEDVTAVAAVTGIDSLQVYGVDSTANAVLSLGEWPALGKSDVLFDLVPDGETPSTVFASPFLATDGSARLAAGYTEPFNPMTGTALGKVAVYDLAQGGSSLTHVDAPLNYTAAFLGDRLVVNGGGLGAASEGNALYWWDDTELPSTGLLAVFDEAWQASSGFSATAAGVLAAGGFYDDGDGAGNHLLRVTAAEADAVVDGSDAIDLAAAERVATGAIFAAGASREPTFVLETTDDATTIELIASIADDLLVGVSDDDGRRLLRIAEGS
jgi:hypothetical protein